jgi:hypothetical protein
LRPLVPIALLGCGSLIGCFPPDEGTDPPSNRLYYPVGAALSSGGGRLYVANSNFDLQFNAGTLQAFDADAIRERLPVPCAADADCPGALSCDLDGAFGAPATRMCVDGSGDYCRGLTRPAPRDSLQAPALCGPMELDDILLEVVRIAPFVTDLKYGLYESEAGNRRARLFLPVRGDATLHWADVENDLDGGGPVLDCGQDASGTCDDDHRRGDRADEGQLPDDRAPTEPFSVAVSGDGRAVVVAHQQRGIISLYENTNRGPELQSVLDGLPLNPMGLAAVPPPALATVADVDYQPGFLVSYRFGSGSSPSIELLRYFDRERSKPGSPFLQRSSASPITVSSSGADSRGIVVDDLERETCERRCESDCGTPLPKPDTATSACVECQSDCAKHPLTAYVANRSPEALLIGQTRSILADTFRDDVPSFSDVEPLRGGPSRVFVGDVIDEAGEPARRIFVVAFDSRLLYVFDPLSRTVETRIQTGRGPHAFAIDSKNGVGYLVHFTDSYIGVLDLDKRHPTYGRFLVSVGQPNPPRSAR